MITKQFGIEHKLMDDNQFWKIIDDSLLCEIHTQDEFILEELRKLSISDILSFHYTLDLHLHEINDAFQQAIDEVDDIEEFDVPYDDHYEYTVNGILALGQEIFKDVLSEPDLGLLEDNEFEGLTYLAFIAFKEKTGYDLFYYENPDLIDCNREKVKSNEKNQ